jgi:hypothetical protein
VKGDNVPDWDARMAMQHPRLCTAKRVTDGKPCGAYAIRGGSVCMRHGGCLPVVRAKAQQRLDFAKDIMLMRAVRGLAPDPRTSPADKRLAKAVAKRVNAEQSARRATRPAGPPAAIRKPDPPPQPKPHPKPPAERTAMPPDSTGATRDAPDRADTRIPPWAEPMELPRQGLVTIEEANAEVNAFNRRARQGRIRRKP